MKKHVYFIIAIVTGAFLSLEGALYGKLGERVGELEANFYNFFMGAIISLIFLIFFGKGKISALSQFPKWNLIGGVLGVTYLVVIVIGIPLVGVGIAMITVVIGQMFASILIDHFGWFGIDKKEIGRKRISALILMIMALVFTMF
ncbi:transporter family-2 protein [Fontibacillus solani]|uniref:Transporter family-2 protein n=1 Tax=Fontibacillus solani TaxID=1572857 RepID=A0A7W3SY86_9BACL|nr:DMT family transporter [Fontibacillus solani]MBA9088437.1 transporter family-2 protein [Fontibacillus solani]